jgi:hypothetical protein
MSIALLGCFNHWLEDSGIKMLMNFAMVRIIGVRNKVANAA